MIEPKFAEAIEREVVWNNDEIIAYECAMVEAGLKTGGRPFGVDDVPAKDKPEGKGIAGSVCHMLRTAHVIDDFWGDIPELGIVRGRRRSRDLLANGRKINTYVLASITAAEEFLRRHGRYVKRQLELAI